MYVEKSISTGNGLEPLYSAYPASLDTSVLVDFEMNSAGSKSFGLEKLNSFGKASRPFRHCPFHKLTPCLNGG